jgi:glutamine amidotransferase
VITIVDYGLGNIHAFLNLYRRMGIEARAARSADQLRDARLLILPGVGHFDHAMERLDASGMRDTLDELVLTHGVPVLGVCVGMQILARGSDEGERAGLGWVDGHVRAFAGWEPARGLPLPHMGWNDVRARETGGLFAELETDSRFYFLHSFFFECARADDAAAVACYGADFTCAVRHEHILGVQFHPEKSHHFGARLLHNFATT